MNTTTINDIEIRKACIADRSELLQVIDRAFSTDERDCDFLSMLPHLFRDARIADHFVAIIDGKIAGVIGNYEFPLLVNGIECKISGIGQVSCDRAYRGRGVMSALLTAVCNYLDASDIDFSFLYGDRQRYARYGWIKGCLENIYASYDKYMPHPDPDLQIENIDIDADAQMIYDTLAAQGNGMLMDI